MKTIKARINSVLISLLILTGVFAFVAYGNYQKTENIQDQIAKSLLTRDWVKNLDPQKRNSEDLKKLRAYKNELSNPDRRLRVSNMIQAYNANNARLYKTRVQEFEKQEQSFFTVAQWTASKYKKTAHFYGLIAMSLPLMGLFWLIYYFNFGLLNPLQGLSQRMMEFLTDQYTFRFSSPANNEIGNLERTFNALAQKVLNNIDELQSLDRAKSEFVSMASHELRTPLTSIKGSLGLLSNDLVGELDPASKDMVLIAEQETDRLVRLINDMLDLAKIEARSLSLNEDWVNLEDLFQDTASGLQGFASTAEVKILVSPLQTPLEVFVDRDRIQQVITNLISNAIKFSPKGGQVQLFTNRSLHSDLEICIQDEGPGLCEEDQRKIFEKFRQASGPSSDLVKGTGLGLAISKALVEQHQGEIGVNSEPGQGARFYFTLKKWRPAQAQTPQHSNQKLAS